jgi:hypothetical protein
MAGDIVGEIQCVHPINTDEKNMFDSRLLTIHGCGVKGTGEDEQSEEHGKEACKSFHGVCSCR